MPLDVIMSGPSVPASEVLSQAVEGILEVLFASKNVLIEKESFLKLSSYLERIVPVLNELRGSCFNHHESLSNPLNILNHAVKVAKQLTMDCGKQSKVYLLINCRTTVKRLEDAAREIGRALSLIPLTSMDLSSGIIDEIEKLSDILHAAEFRAAVAGEEILQKIESGIQERNVDRSYANKLLVLIAEAVGISTERPSLKKEFEEFKGEIENARLRKDQAEAIQMDQIIALLERADAASSPAEREVKYLNKRNSLGSQPLEPLQSFYCPITREVMVDPVETSSGQTFERSAIEKWFAEGNKSCPMTKAPLDISVLRPNRTLRQSILEWKDRNTLIRIATMKSKLHSQVEADVLDCLKWLQGLCEERDIHRDWVVMESYIPILIERLKSKNRDIRNHVLGVLCILVRDSDDAKERIAKVENALDLIVRSLSRRPEEGKSAVLLLNELSSNHIVRDCIGPAQNCILLLITLSGSDDVEAARVATKLLECLSFSVEHIIQMANANYFKHLLHCLSSGPEGDRVTMARTLSDMKLTDHNKSHLFECGVLKPLLHLVSSDDTDTKLVAVRALQNLASLPANGLQMIRGGVVRPLLDLLLPYGSSSTRLREHVAATLRQIAISTTSQEANELEVSMLECSEDVSKLFSLVSLTGPEIQKSILCTFITLCHSCSATRLKAELTQCSALSVLVQLCEIDNLSVRANAVKLFCCLVEDGNAMILEYDGRRCIENLIKIIKSSNDEEEVAYAMGILSHLPKDPHIHDFDALPCILSFLLHNDGRQHGPHKDLLLENAVGSLCHFTDPQYCTLQMKVAELGAIPVLVRLLETGTTLMKTRAAVSLGQLSMSSHGLSKPQPRRPALCCFSSSTETRCPVHLGICTVESSFCLVKADAVGPLVKVLGNSDSSACRASLDALLTLVEGEGLLQRGSKVLDDEGAIPVFIGLLSSPSPGLAEKALEALERIFRQSEFKNKYGPSAQMPFVEITQRGSSSMKSLAARILGHLNVFPDQSSYF